MELQHFSHEHPLIFTEDHKEEDKDRCNGCLQLLSGPSYTCHIMHCYFHLHKSCAELSPQIEHPIHPEHPLTLFAKPPRPHQICRCYACQKDWTGFTYSCSICDFDIDTVCAQKQQIIKHASHLHPLTLLRRTALFFCNACGLEHGGMSYLCNTCQFWIQESCASLPDTVKHFDHDHPLALCYSFPQEYYNFVFRCDICSYDLNKTRWTYFCAGCRFFAHLNCATSQKQQSRDEETEIRVEDSVINLIPLPVTDESVDLIAYFLNLGQNERTTELNHSSHDHALVLFNAQITDEFCSETKPTLLKKTENNKICNGCAQSISVPFYHCAQCRFFLHKSCAELPTEVKHPCHPEHPLTLLTKNPSCYGIFRCKVCRTYCNGFAYKCNSCAFYLDARCGSLPGAIKHEAHKHPLLLTNKRSSRCNACHISSPKWTFGCETCNFNLHIQCALLPGIIRHRYDEHPFILNYFPVKDHPDEYYCEICCEELNPKCWFYHCGECDQSIHCECISRVDEFSNIKFGGTVEVVGHSHLLTLVRKTKGDSKCDYCGAQINLCHFAFECAQCDFKMHSACAF